LNTIIDGYIYQAQSNGGISRILDNVLPIICDLDPNLRIKLFTRSNLSKQLPSHKNISWWALNSVNDYFRPWRIWRKSYPILQNLFLKALIGKTKRKIWFSSYYSIPPFRWDGYQIVFVHDFIHERFSNLFPDSEQQIKRKREAILKADAIICNSRTTANDLQNFYSIHEKRIFISELGVDHNFKKLSDDLITKKVDFPFILYLGKRKYYKGFDTLLSAYSSWKKNENIKIIVVGTSWSKEEETYIKCNNLESKIILLSNVDDNELCDLYNQAKAFVYPSLYEGFGIPLLEAMACGCPIVASRIPSTVEVAQDIPFYFNPGDVDELINTLHEVAENGRDSSKVKNGLTLVSQYSWENTASKILDVFNLFLN